LEGNDFYAGTYGDGALAVGSTFEDILFTKALTFSL